MTVVSLIWDACLQIKARRLIIVLLPALLASQNSVAAELPPRAILVLEQSSFSGPYYAAVLSGLRSEVNEKAASPVTMYMENLDLSQFTDFKYQQSLRDHLEVKYQEKPVGVIVTIGAAALDFALRWRGELWPDVPVVFADVEQRTVAQLQLPSDVIGRSLRIASEDVLAVARLVVPDLQRVAIVGDRLVASSVQVQDEILALAAKLEVINLIGLPMRELRKRVAALPDDSAIIYTSIYSDGEGTSFPPADAVAMIAEAANRPIVAYIASLIGRGAIGGYVVVPSVVGREAGALSLRILDGESPNAISISVGDSLRPVFDGRQLRKWNVDIGNLPDGSEIQNQVFTVWEQYPWQMAVIVAVMLLQTGLIAGLVDEHRRRRTAEVEARKRLTELAHMNRHATVGELSASLAHEINQPLGAILSNTQAAERLLKSSSPDLNKISEILASIRRDDQRASDVIVRLRSLLKKVPSVRQPVDVNDVVRAVFDFVSVPASDRGISLERPIASTSLMVSGDSIQLQQVVLNLVVNGMEALSASASGGGRISGRTDRLDDQWIEIAIADSGPGIPPDRLTDVFEPFFTSKDHGMGMGLSIARTIVEAHGGRISAENQLGGGAVFRVELPIE